MTSPYQPIPQGWAMPPIPPAPKPFYKRWWFRVVVAVGVISALLCVLVIAAVAGEFRKKEEINARISETAIEGCESSVTDYAKHPAAAEFDDPLEPLPEVAESHQGTEDTAFITVNLGTVQFVNGFGVPSPYYFGCVTYHDEEGNLVNSRSKVEEAKTFLDEISYDYEYDSLN
ncbi:hypothetical protein ACFWGD_05955 [Corynebacterium sp. NPDC060344]|uniref:hypothetical protein n=1 Tax=Corynebacterium sp. NPDC060344 TaxID=3347101 RepID=UPI003651DD6A